MTEYDFELDEAKDLASLDFGGKTEDEVKTMLNLSKKIYGQSLNVLGRKFLLPKIF